jgi:hypothetical protein
VPCIIETKTCLYELLHILTVFSVTECMTFIVTERFAVFMKQRPFATVAFCNTVNITGGRSVLPSEVRATIPVLYNKQYTAAQRSFRRVREILKIFQTNDIEKIRTHISCFFPQNRAFYEIM